MAINTPMVLRKQVIYSIFVRNYSKEGTFAKVQADLPRIKALGVDIIWLMPIHPIGKVNRKGELGSPYAIRDYRVINPEYGTLEDFKALVNAIHAHGMRCIIDVVYNHTAPDSWLREHHPEWFYHKADGSFGNHVGDWSDIIDLNYEQPGLWDYQIDTLKMWAEIVDGFRCDVAPMVPLPFWQRARQEVASVRPDCLWLAESSDPFFLKVLRGMGIPASSDSELYQVFDICYDYDIYHHYVRYCTDRGSLADFIAAVNNQEVIYPVNFVKMRTLENHDQPRAAALIPDGTGLRSWLAYIYFAKGITMIYNGQEVGATLRPDLFEKDDICWNTNLDLTSLLQRLYTIRQQYLPEDSTFTLQDAGHGVIFAEHLWNDGRLAGFFCTQGHKCTIHCELPEGIYTNLIDDKSLRVANGVITLDGEPVIVNIDQ